VFWVEGIAEVRSLREAREYVVACPTRWSMKRCERGDPESVAQGFF